jgi:hypothetical protein
MNTGIYGYSAEWITSVTGSNINVTKRWKRAGRVPEKYRQWIEFMKDQNLGALLPQWDGWIVRDGALWTPERECITQGRIRAIPYKDALIRELQLQVSEPQQWKLL